MNPKPGTKGRRNSKRDWVSAWVEHKQTDTTPDGQEVSRAGADDWGEAIKSMQKAGTYPISTGDKS